MAKTLSDIDWEIEQVSLAMDYYEEALRRSMHISEMCTYNDIIKDLNRTLKKLERERNDYEG